MALWLSGNPPFHTLTKASCPSRSLLSHPRLAIREGFVQHCGDALTAGEKRAARGGSYREDRPALEKAVT